MKTTSRVLLTAAATAMAVVISREPLLARGGAANIMNSPGYQRRLQESRQQLPEVKPTARPLPHHHHKRHRH